MVGTSRCDVPARAAAGGMEPREPRELCFPALRRCTRRGRRSPSSAVGLLRRMERVDAPSLPLDSPGGHYKIISCNVH